ncbi:MAG: molybdopterin-dependent oxidoreductase [Pseudomonadota bacterium]
MNRISVWSGLAALLSIIPLVCAAHANKIDARKKTVLTIEAPGKRADYNWFQLEDLPKTRFRTSTPWTEGRTRFEGVRLKDVLEVTGIKARKLRAVALNAYFSEMLLADVEDSALIATHVDGKRISVRDKGPLWIIFPFDSRSELKSEVFYSRSVWQLRKILVVE